MRIVDVTRVCLEMADVPSIQAKVWSSEDMSSKQDSLVPGVNDVGNRRPKVKVKGGKTKEVKAAVPVTQPVVVETTDTHGKTITSSGFLSTDISTLGTDISSLQSRGVTLKDLCAEDKKRIANLIKELARVGEEKENAEQNLTAERQHYQQQVLTLVQQQEAILKEREDVQTRLLEYQSYIVKMQQQEQLKLLLQKQKRNRQEKQHDVIHSNNDIRNEAVKHKSHKDDSQQQTGMLGNKRTGGGKDGEKLHSKRSNFVGTQEVDTKPGIGKSGTLQDWNNEQEESFGEDEEEDLTLEGPSTHLYINQTNTDPVDQSDGLDGLSTHVLPSESPPPQAVIDGSSNSRPLPHRPFTAMIDRQLTRERRKVEEVETDRMKEEEGHYENKAGLEKKEAGLNVNGRKQKNNNTNEKEDETGLRNGGPVSPEKAELFSRFMGVQSEVGCRYGNKNSEYFDAGDGGKEKKMGARHDRRVSSNHHRRPRRHQHKEPSRHPQLFGGFFPPIMSSTQKSSEIGDYVSNVGDSTLVTNAEDQDKPVVPGREDGNQNDVHSDDGFVKFGRTDEKRSGVGVADSRMREMRRKREDGLREEADRKNSGEKEVVHDDEVNVGAPMGADKEFLTYYKKLSASERKDELLKQRAVLMEEQNKLRQLLTKHEHHKSTRSPPTLQQQQQQTEDEDQGDVMTVTDTGKTDREVFRQENKVEGRQWPSHDGMSDVVVSGHGVRKGREVRGHNSHRPSNGNKNNNRDVAGDFGSRNEGRGQGRRLFGRDGEECVTYCHKEDKGSGGVDAVVKRLEYSLTSYEEEEIPTSPSSLDKKFIVSPDNQENHDDHFVSPASRKKSMGVARTDNSPLRSNPKSSSVSGGGGGGDDVHTMVDAGTSMSFASIPRDWDSVENSERSVRPSQTNLPVKSIREGHGERSIGQRKMATPPSRSSFSKSPGNKTLAVLKIINSLPDDDHDDTGLYDASTNHSKQPMVEAHGRLPRASNSRDHQPSNRPHKLNRPSPGLRRSTDHPPDTKTRKSLFVERRRRGGSLEVGDDDEDEEDDEIVGLSGRVRGNVGVGGRVSSWSGGGGRLRGGEVIGSRKSKELSGLRRVKKSTLDAELKVFDCYGFREERLSGLRKIANGGNDDDDNGGDESEGTFYDYDDDDDSNIDDMVHELLLSGVDDFTDDNVDERRRGRGGGHLNESVDDDDDDEDEVMEGLNGMSGCYNDKNRGGKDMANFIDDNDDDELDDYQDDDSFKLQEVDDIDDDDIYDDDDDEAKTMRVAKSGARGTKDKADIDSEESAILEDVFFVNH